MTKLISGLCALVLAASACGSSSPSSSDQAAVDEETPADAPDGGAGDDEPAESTTPDDSEVADPADGAEVPVDLPAADAIVLSVNGDSMTGADLATELDEWAAAFASDPTATVTAGDGFAPGFVAFVLTQHVQLTAVQQAASGLGLAFDEADRATAAEELAAQLPELPVDGVVYEQLSSVQALLLSLEPSEEQIAEYFEVNSEQFPPVLCSRHILHDTVEDADATLVRLADGEQFGEVAVDVSTGPTGPDGGDLGCVPEGSFVPEFEAAAYGAGPGEVVGPVETQFGFHVIEVLSIGPPELDVVQAQIVDEITADATAPLSEAVTSAAVEVDSAVGTWDPASGQVALVG